MAARTAALVLWTIEHPVPVTVGASAATASAGLPDNRYQRGVFSAYSPRYGPAEVAQSPVTVGNVTINVQGGNSDADTLQNIKDAIGSWFQQAVDRVGSPTGGTKRQLGGAYGT